MSEFPVLPARPSHSRLAFPLCACHACRPCYWNFIAHPPIPCVGPRLLHVSLVVLCTPVRCPRLENAPVVLKIKTGQFSASGYRPEAPKQSAWKLTTLASQRCQSACVETPLRPFQPLRPRLADPHRSVTVTGHRRGETAKADEPARDDT